MFDQVYQKTFLKPSNLSLSKCLFRTPSNIYNENVLQKELTSFSGELFSQKRSILDIRKGPK